MLELVKLDAQAVKSVCSAMIDNKQQQDETFTTATTDTHNELNSHLDIAADKTNPTTQYRIICGENTVLGGSSAVHCASSKSSAVHESSATCFAAVHDSAEEPGTVYGAVHESSVTSAGLPLNFCVALTRNGRVWRYHGTHGFQLQRSARKYTEDQFRAIVRAEYVVFSAKRHRL